MFSFQNRSLKLEEGRRGVEALLDPLAGVSGG